MRHRNLFTLMAQSLNPQRTEMFYLADRGSWALVVTSQPLLRSSQHALNYDTVCGRSYNSAIQSMNSELAANQIYASVGQCHHLPPLTQGGTSLKHCAPGNAF